MYQVSNDYLEKMLTHAVRRRVTGTLGDIPITGDDIILQSMEIVNKCTESSKFEIAGVYIGQITLRFKPSILTRIPRDQIRDKDLTVNIGLLLDEENDTWEDIPCGIYTLQSPKISKEGVEVEGYDYMKKFDKTFNSTSTSGNIYDLLLFACRACNVELGMTAEECALLPNGDIILSMYADNDVETYRDIVYWVAQTCGRFATINRTGQLVLRKMGVPTGVTIDEDHRDDDVVFSGYTTHYTGVSVVDIENQTTHYYGLPTDDGLTMNLGSNPFLQYKVEEENERRIRLILDEVAAIEYVPFTVSSVRDPIFDLGDEIEFTGGLSGGCYGCIMMYSYAMTDFEFEGYGDDPALANGRSKTDKNISGLMSKTESDAIAYYGYENAVDIYCNDEYETVIASLDIAAKIDTTVVIMLEFTMDLLDTTGEVRTTVYKEEDQSGQTVVVENGFVNNVEVYVNIYHNGVPELYQPVETWTEISNDTCEGKHTLTCFGFIKVDTTVLHNISASVLMRGGNGVVWVGNSKLLVTGQGLVKDESSGKIKVEEEIESLPNVKALTIINLSDDNPYVDVIMTTEDTYSYSDTAEDVDMISLETANAEDTATVVVKDLDWVVRAGTNEGLYSGGDISTGLF